MVKKTQTKKLIFRPRNLVFDHFPARTTRFNYFPTIYYAQQDLWKNKKKLQFNVSSNTNPQLLLGNGILLMSTLTPVGDHIEVYLSPWAPSSVSAPIFDVWGVLRAFVTICGILQTRIVLSHVGQSYPANIHRCAPFIHFHILTCRFSYSLPSIDYVPIYTESVCRGAAWCRGGSPSHPQPSEWSDSPPLTLDSLSNWSWKSITDNTRQNFNE